MKVFYRKGSLQGNADFFSRILDLGDGTHEVRLTVNEPAWNDSEFDPMDSLSPQSICTCASALIAPTQCSLEEVVLPIEEKNADPPEDPYLHHALPPVSLADLRTHQEADPLCQAISNYE